MIIEAAVVLTLLGLGVAALKRRPTVTVSTGRVTVANRVITGPTGQYTLTDDDLLWLARAVKGEAESNIAGGTAVCWALAQNFMLVGRRPPRMTPFSRLVRNYCQPVNPKWDDPNGAACQRNPQACTPDKIARRRRLTTMPWANIDRPITDLVTRWAAGQVPNTVPGMTDWAAASSGTWPGAQVNIGGNLFGVSAGRTLVA